jgi:hypothetical protein
MIVRDEAALLPRCLASLSALAPQIVVVDTGSQDSTAAVARSFGAEVFAFAWVNDFSLARNASLQRATGRWILVLDADEWLEGPSSAEIARLVQEEPMSAFELVQKSTDSSGGVIRNSMVRLFPNRVDIRFTHKVHEDVVTSLARASLPIIKTQIVIEHSGYVDPNKVREKTRRNRAILEAALAQGCDPETEPHARFNMGVVLFDEGKISDALGHFEWCIRNSQPHSRIARICSLRAANCHFVSGQPQQALALLPSEPLPSHHPVALMLVAKILHARDPRAARPWLEALLATPNTAQSPPVSVGPLKTGAIAALGNLWLNEGRLHVAKELLALARSMQSGQVDPASDQIAASYATILEGNGQAEGDGPCGSSLSNS